MKNNIYAIYLGCAGILAGGIGLAYDHSAGDSQAQEPLFVQAGLTPVPEPGQRQPEWQSGWPPANAAVAFHDEMVALLTPQTTQGTAARAQQPPQAAREVIREPAATDQRQRTRTSRRPQVPDQTVGVGHDGDDESRAANSRGANRRDGRRGREPNEVDVIGRDGRSYRIERGDDDDAPPPGARRYRGEREAPVERPVTPDPFRLFGGGW